MKYFYLLIFLIVQISCSNSKKESFSIETFAVDEISIRAIEAIDEHTMWFAGSNGKVGYTQDGGQSFKIHTIAYDTLMPEFRAIARTKEAVFVLSIASPALLYKSSDMGENWEIVYKEDDKAAFYNSMAISKSGLGVAVGDPIDKCLSVLISEDYGNTWSKLSCDILPVVVDGEAGFAASNSNVQIIGDSIWLVSGGTKARVFHSENRGESWSVYNTPIINGGQMTGIYSTHFYDSKHGFIFGGDWNSKETNTKNKAFSDDGGRTWTLLANGEYPGYRSSVRYIPNSNAKKLIAVGTPGTSLTKDGGKSWVPLNKESFYTIRFTPNGKTAWLAGANKIGRMSL